MEWDWREVRRAVGVFNRGERRCGWVRVGARDGQAGGVRRRCTDTPHFE